MDWTGPTDPYKISIILVWSVFYTECYILQTWSAKYCIQCVIMALFILWIIVGMVAHVQSLVHYTSCCMCDSDESVLKMLSTNAAQPIFSARNEAIGWEEAYDILQSQHQYSCCNSPPVKPRAGEGFLFSATEASKRSKLVIHEVVHASLSSVAT